MGEDCTCEPDPYDPADYGPGEVIEESWHYRRVCEFCGTVFWSLHCPHDGAQGRCPECGRRPSLVASGIGGGRDTTEETDG